MIILQWSNNDVKVQEPSVDNSRSIIAFGNSTFSRSSVTAANVTSSSTTTDSGSNLCDDLYASYARSFQIFQNSVSSASAAGKYSTTIYIQEESFANVEYSFLFSTPKYGNSNMITGDPYVISAIPTATTKSAWTETRVLTPVYTNIEDWDCDTFECTANPNNCTISAESVQLLYWPVSTVSGYPNVTVTSNATESVIAVINGTTFTSPTVYLSYAGVSARDNCYRPVGKSYRGTVIGVSPSAVASIDSPHYYATTFNFADFNTPYSPYVLSKLCWPAPAESCIIDAGAVYNPRLVVPEEIRSLDPAWKTCDPDWLGSYDPPRILVPAQVLVNPTPAADARATSSTATPALSFKTHGVASTSTLDTRKSSPSDGSSAVFPQNLDPSNVDPSNTKTLLKSASATNSPARETPFIDPLGQNQNSPTRTGAVEGPSTRASLTTDPSDHKSDAQNKPAMDPPANDPPTNDLSTSNSPTAITKAIDFSTNDPPAKVPATNSSPTKTPVAKESPSQPSGHSSHSKDSNILLPHVTLYSQIFTTDPASDSVIGSETLTHRVEISVSGAPLSVPHHDLSIDVSPTSRPIIIVGSQYSTANYANHYIIDSQTLIPGSQITVAGTPISAPTIPIEIHLPTHTLPLPLVSSETYSAVSASQYITAFPTLTSNGKIVVSGTPVSLQTAASNIAIGSIKENMLPALASPTALNSKAIALVVGSTTTALVPTFSLPALTIASEIYTADSKSQYIIVSQTLTPNGQIVVAGTTVSLPASASAVIIDGITNSFKPTLGLPPITFGSETFTADSASQYIINHQTLSPGGHITISGTSISLASEVPALASESSEEPSFSRFSLPLITIGSKIYTANQASAYIINHQALTPGAQITVDGTPALLAPQASALAIGSATRALLHFALPTLTINSKVYTANPSSAYNIKGQTLRPGGQISVDGKVISLASQASVLIIGSTTKTLLVSSALPSVTVVSEVNTANSAFAYVTEGQTLTAGGQITIDGTPVSLATNGSELIVGSTTESLGAISSTVGLGQVIMEAFNGVRRSGSDDRIDGTTSSTLSGRDGSSGGNRAIGAATTNVTSVTSTPASNPTKTTPIFAGGARTRWNRSWIEFATVLSAIFVTLH